MLQRALASLLCLLGAASIGLGVASATAWRPADTLSATASGPAGSTLLMTDPGVLDMAADTVTVKATARSGDRVVLALGRTADVEAWIGSDAYARVTGLADRVRLATDAVAPSPTPSAAATDAAATAAPPADQTTASPSAEVAPAAAVAPDPTGSDLWIAEKSGAHDATLRWTHQDGRWSVLAASVGDGAGPVSLTLSWPQTVTTPWLVPGVVVGSLLLLAGLGWWAVILLGGRPLWRLLPAGLLPGPRPPRVSVPAGAARTGSVPTPVVSGAQTPGSIAHAPADLQTPAAGSASGPAPASAMPMAGAPAATTTSTTAATTGVVPVGSTTGVVPVGSTTAAAAPAAGAPMTRRQLRERDQQLALEAGRREGSRPAAAQPERQESDLAATGPSAVAAGPGSAGRTSQDRPAVLVPPTAQVRPTAQVGPTAQAGPTAQVGPTAQAASTAPVHAVAQASLGSQAGAGPRPVPSTEPADQSAAAEGQAGPERPAGWGRRLSERFPRREARSRDAAGTQELPTEPDPAVPDAPATLAHTPQAAATPSADLWRRAWGFPSEPGTGSPAAGSTPGWRPTQPPETARPEPTDEQTGDGR